MGYICRRWLRRRILAVVQVRLVSEATECTGVRFTSKTGDTIMQKAYDQKGTDESDGFRGKKKGGSP
jgi:hypothetical protein